MTIALRALDLMKRRAVLQDADRLYLMSEKQAWRPAPLDQERYEAFLVEPEVIQVRMEYKTLPDLILSLPRLLAGARSLLGRHSGSREDDEPGVLWTRNFLVQSFQDRLDSYFCNCGCSQEDSILLAAAALHRLYQEGPRPDEVLLRRLWELSRVVYHDRYGKQPRARLKPAPTRRRMRSDWGPLLKEALAFEEERLRKALSKLDRPVLRNLLLWLEPRQDGSRYNEVELGRLLRISAEQASLWLDLVLSRLRLSQDQLLDPRLRQAVRKRLGLPASNQLGE